MKEEILSNILMNEIGKEPMSEKEDEKEMSEFGDGEGFKPHITVTSKELPGIEKYKSGDKVCLEVKATIKSYSYLDDDSGRKEQRYTLRLDSGSLEDYAMEDSKTEE